MQEPTEVSASEAASPLILAIDAGTSSVRAVVYDGRARKVAGWEVHRPYSVTTTSDGGITADADLLLDLTVACVDDVAALVAESGRRVDAVACDTFWHSLLGVDEGGRAMTEVFTWADTRSGVMIPKLRERVDAREVHARTGVELHSSYWPAKLLWLEQDYPRQLESVRYWMSFAEFLYLRLFGERRVSLSMASGTGLLDENSCEWDRKLIASLPIDAGQLSPLADFSDAFTRLQAPYRGRWPALHGAPWYLALGDGACNNVGCGGFCEEWVVVMVGTSGAIRVVRETDHVTIPSGLWTYRLDRRRIVQGGALSAGGNVFAWLLKTLNIQDVNALEAEVLTMPPASHGITMLPFLAGERSPNWNPDARAALVGFSLDTTAPELVRAALESVALQFGLVYDIIRKTIPSPRGIIGSGAGLIHSPAWMQIMTDVVGEPLVASAVPEASSRGAALLTLETMGSIKDIGAIGVPLATRYEPKSENTVRYREAMRRQTALYGLLTGAHGTDVTA